MSPIEIRRGPAGLDRLREEGIAGKVIHVEVGCACELCQAARKRARFDPRIRIHVKFQPAHSNMRPFHIWLPCDRAYAESEGRACQEGTALAEYVVALQKLGLKGETVPELFRSMLGRTFFFESRTIGRMRSPTWVPAKLIEEEADAVRACAEFIASHLEPGSVVGMDDIVALLRGAGLTYSSEVIEKAVESLVSRKRLHALPTKELRYFFEG